MSLLLSALHALYEPLEKFCCILSLKKHVQASSDEDELDTEEKRQLLAQRSLLLAVLNDTQGILEELIRKRVLEDADGAVDIYELRERFLLRNQKDEDLLEPIIERLSKDDRLYLLEAIENSTFKDAAGEAISSIGVELENASLTEVDEAEEDELAMDI